ncbi:MAG: hypothetical protein ACT4P1_07615 [Sporichthyaceae bacterium]
MNAILDPVGRRPSAVYWRRRAVMFAALAAATLLLAKACGTNGPNIGPVAQQQPVPLLSTFTPTPTPTPTSTIPFTRYTGKPKPTASAQPADKTKTAVKAAKNAEPEPTSDAQIAGPVACAKSNLRVVLRTDERIYSTTSKPKLFLGVKNTGENACLADLGSRALSFTIVSGKDRIWSSDDCQGKGTKDIRLLEPGQELFARSVWSLVRSQPGCPKGLANARAGTYVLEGSAAGVPARKRAVFDIR